MLKHQTQRDSLGPKTEDRHNNAMIAPLITVSTNEVC